MLKATRGLTRVETIVLLVLLMFGIVVVFVILPILARDSHHRGPACNSNLGQITKACITYQEANDEFYPAYWDGERFDPMMSLALLYPTYIDNFRVFGCPQTKDKPIITVRRVNGNEVQSFGPVSGKNKCSYFYDPVSHFRDVGPGQAMAADADGMAWWTPEGNKPDYPDNWQRKPRKPNHESGQNVMYFDGHVRWTETNYVSDDPLDNIFCPNEGWGADTDAYLWDGVNARPAEAAP